jgi:hypothetical protein
MSNKVLKILILVAILLFIISAGFFWFGRPSFREKDVLLKLEGPLQVKAGDQVTYKLKYSNETKLPLYDVKLSFTYPSESIALKSNGTKAESSDDKEVTESYDIGTVMSGSSEEKELDAILIGERGDIRTARAVMTFRAGSLTSPFEKTAAIGTTIMSLPVSLTLISPSNVIDGQNVNYLLDYKNESDQTIPELRVEFTYPEGFISQEYSPQPSEQKNIWILNDLKPGESGRITVLGVIYGKEGETKVLKVDLKRKLDGSYITYEKAVSSSLMANPLLSLDILVNGSRSFVANAGNTLKYTINFKNSSNLYLSGMTLSAKLDGTMFDLTTLDTRGGYYDSTNRTIVWSEGVIPFFSSFDPNTKGKAEFQIKLKKTFPSGYTGSNSMFLKVTAKLSTPNVPPSIDASEIFTTANLVTNISTQPTLTQMAYYAEQGQEPMGPFPPQAGKETIYTVHWELSNPGNSMVPARISATLPDGASWKAVSTATANQAPPIYNRAGSEVIWNLPSLPAGTGGYSEKYEAVFRIGFIPSEAQKGKAPAILTNVKLTGTDSVTNQTIIINEDNITTDTISDQPDGGRVQ